MRHDLMRFNRMNPIVMFQNLRSTLSYEASHNHLLMENIYQEPYYNL